MPAPGDWLSAGRVGRAHGLDGSFHVTGARASLLGAGAPLRLGVRATTIVRRAGTDDRPIIRVAGIASREAAEGVRGHDLLAPRSAAPPLGADEYWPEDLEGAAVTDGARAVGVVRRMVGYPSVDVLEVARDGAPDLLVPLVRDAIRCIDLAARRVDVDLGFLGE